ncbi:MAG: hypothetical protein GEU90_16025 [Gemmatimonas sp.]|nr:hypothetical protein [Gemmatimonas sp.]
MTRIVVVAFAVLFLSAAGTSASAQDYRPSWRRMPQMPAMSELAGDWLGPRSNWFNGTARVSGVPPSDLTPVGQARGGGRQAQVVHFNSGPVPAVVWQDRNGDGNADIVEIYRGGGVSVQVVDADYDGTANVLRIYDAGGALTREERL